MTIEQIKKSAKNLQRLLPEFLKEHEQPFLLTDLQKLVAQTSGYPNMEFAVTALKRGEDDGQDALGSFYRYPWFEIDPLAVLNSINRNPKVNIDLVMLDVASAPAWFEKRRLLLLQREPNRGTPTQVIVAAGKAGGDLVDQMLEHVDRGNFNESLTTLYGGMSCCTLRQQSGIAMNWLAGWTRENIASVLQAFVRPVCSEAQFNACSEIISCVVDAVDSELPSEEADSDSFYGRPARVTVDSLSSKLQAFLAITEAGWSMSPDDDLVDEFDDDPESLPSELLAKYSDKNARALARPIESLLARLVALSGGGANTSPLGHSAQSDNINFSSGGDIFGLNFIVVEMETRRLDHVIAMAVLSKFAATVDTSFQQHFFWDETPPPLEVVLIVR